MDLRYHVYHNNECIASCLTEDKFVNLIQDCQDKKLKISYEMVEINQLRLEESSY